MIGVVEITYNLVGCEQDQQKQRWLLFETLFGVYSLGAVSHFAASVCRLYPLWYWQVGGVRARCCICPGLFNWKGVGSHVALCAVLAACLNYFARTYVVTKRLPVCLGGGFETKSALQSQTCLMMILLIGMEFIHIY